MYKVGDEVVFNLTKESQRMEYLLDGGNMKEVHTITQVGPDKNFYLIPVQSVLWYVHKDDFTLAKVVELPIYKALTELEC
jgi:hypothetical protein